MPGSSVLDDLLKEARPEQKEAVTAPEPFVVVGAGAGTGKTKTLAWRFLWALLAFPETRVENILTLTFTEKAAREMRDRIAKMLESARKEAEARGLEDAAARLFDARSRLDEAYISTIHAFALRVIRESGLALPLDPGAGLVCPPQEEAFWENFSSVLDSLNPGEAARGLPEPWRARAESLAASAEVAEAVNAWGPENLAAFAREAVGLHGSRGLDPEALWGWDPAQDEAVRASLLAGHRLLWVDRLALFHGRVFPGLGDLSRDRSKLASRVSEFREKWDGPDPETETAERLLEFLEDLDSTLKGAGGKLKDTLAGLMEEAPADAREGLKKELPLARSLVKGLSEEEKAARRTACRCAAIAWARWEQAKASSGTLTFDDLIRYAARAVSANPSYGNRFRHILMDEVQDTDPLQDTLIEALRESGGGRLFMVGDLKQSIYRFRHAEPSLFAGHIRKAMAGGDGRYVLLDRSYRMRWDLVRFVNDCFGPPWADELGKNLGVAYEALVGPSDAPWWEDRNALRTPAVNLLLEMHREDPESEEKEKKAAVRGRLAARLASQLASLRGKPAWDKEHCNVRPLEWRDMAVLVPGRNHYSSLQDAFEAAGIPAVFQKSQGFFSRGEVFDLVETLRALAEPDDRLALSGWLVSPFSGLEKESALRLAGVPEKGNPSLRSRLAAEAPEVAGRFDSLRAKALLAGPAAVLESLLEDPAALKTAPPSDRPRMAANLARAAALAREFTAARGPSLAACASALGSSLRRALPAEEPDFMAEDEDVVRVMTVHAAKGLEFPVVAVMGLDDAGRGNGKGGPLIPSVPLLGVTTSLPGDDAPPAQAILWHRALEKGALDEESERLFYVAVTRAQDALVLCGICPLDGETGEANPKEGSWLSMLAGTHPLMVEEALRQASGETDPPGMHPLPVNPGPALLPGRELELPDPAPTLASVSATGYALYAACPRAWRLQVRQGLELAGEKPVPGEPGGPELGSLAHRILASWDFSAESLDRLLPAELDGPTDRALLRLPPELRAPARRDADRASLRATLMAFLETPAGQEIAAAHGRGILKREWPFRLPLENGPAMAGVIDALWEEDWTVHIRDYKLGQASPFMEGLGTRQLAFYGTVANRLFPGLRLDLSLLFLKAGGEKPILPGSVPPEQVEEEVRAMARQGVAGPFPPNREVCPACPWRTFCGSSLRMGP
jgi:ATP-dependent exoDNAse (exonuclease V) beta subunit